MGKRDPFEEPIQFFVPVGPVAWPAPFVRCCVVSLGRVHDDLLAAEEKCRAELAEGQVPEEMREKLAARLEKSAHDRSHLAQLISALTAGLEHSEAGTRSFYADAEAWMVNERAAGRVPPAEEEEEGELGSGLAELIEKLFTAPSPAVATAGEKQTRTVH